MEHSAIFIYLIHKHGFQQLPITSDDDFFADDLIREAKDCAELCRFLGAYAYVVETFEAAGSDLVCTGMPTSIPRIKISTNPFSETELETIKQYDQNYLKMTQ